MARFDVYENLAGAGHLLDLQTDLLSGLNTRIVAPLLPLDIAPHPAARLNPVFEIGQERVAMVTQFPAAVPASELKKRAGSLAHEHDAIVGALDMLFSGF